MRILAFNITHDSSVCSLNNGEIEFFCKEERLSRVKRDKHPFLSVELFESLKLGKIDHILYHTPSNFEPDVEFVWKAYIQKKFNTSLENYSNLLHHLCHSALAYYNSEFKECLVIVVDRHGSVYFMDDKPVARESESIFICNEKNIKPIYKSFSMEKNYHSYAEKFSYIIKNYFKDCETKVGGNINLVKIYEAATTLIGQHLLENGKTMGLSSYGENKKYDVLKENDFTYYGKQVLFKNEEHLVNKNLNEDNYQYYANKAKQVQLQTQKSVLDLIKKYNKKTGINNICLVGGYGLNVVANQYYLKELPNCNFYFEPVADDTGISIGATMLKYNQITKQKPKPVLNNFYHYYKEEKCNVGNISSLEEVCSLLEQQKSVAIFEGNPEVGPRALGHRSILFDARNKDGKNIMNKIKKREWYRPFAGTILENYLNEHFETILKKSPYMTINFNCKNNLFPAITHVDNTCRIQTVNSGTLFDILNLFNERNNCPILLNTSFNLAGEPLVQTIKDALSTFNKSSLDAVFFVKEKRLIVK